MNLRKVKLGELVENFSIRARDYGGSDGLEFLGVSNEDGITTSKYSAEDKAEDYKIIEKGCFGYNPYRINVGSIAYLDKDIKGLISPAYVIFKTKPKSIKDDLLLKFLKSSEGLRQIKMYARGTVRQALRFEDLCKIELSIPGYDEQEILISKIQEIELEKQKLATELSHQLSLVSQLRQSFLREAMQGKLLPQNPSDGHAKDLLVTIKSVRVKLGVKEKPLPAIKPEDIPFQIPGNWVWCKLGEICKVKVGSTPSRGNLAFWQGNIPWVSSGEVANNFIYDTKEKITQSGFKNTSLILYPKGSVLVAMIGQGKTRGQTSILQIDATTNQNVAGLIIEHDLLVSDFLWYFFLSRYEITRGGASGGNQPALNGVKISNTIFPFPPLHEQHRIVAKLDQLMQTCDALEASIKQSKEQNDMLLQQVLREALRSKS